MNPFSSHTLAVIIFHLEEVENWSKRNHGTKGRGWQDEAQGKRGDLVFQVKEFGPLHCCGCMRIAFVSFASIQLQPFV